MRPGIAHGTGTTGFSERSRVVAASSNHNNNSRIPSVVYLKSQAPGSGTLERPDEVDPRSQAEKFVSRIAGPSEFDWSQRRIDEYQRVRAMRLQIADFRFDILKKSVAEANAETRKVILDNCRGNLMLMTNLSMLNTNNNGNNNGRNVIQDNDIRNYLLLNASPEEIASVLPRNLVMNEIEPQVVQLKEALLQNYSASQMQ